MRAGQCAKSCPEDQPHHLLQQALHLRSADVQCVLACGPRHEQADAKAQHYHLQMQSTLRESWAAPLSVQVAQRRRGKPARNARGGSCKHSLPQQGSCTAEAVHSSLLTMINAVLDWALGSLEIPARPTTKDPLHSRAAVKRQESG